MLPLDQNNGMAPKWRLAYATEIADFYRMQIVVRKILSRGQLGRVGRVSGNKTFFVFLALITFFWPSLLYMDTALSSFNW